MMRIAARLPFLALALFAHCGAAELVDDSDGPGRAASVSYRAMPGDVAVAVQPLDNSPLNLKIAAKLAKALGERGVPVADDAPLLLEFETMTESAAPSRPRGSPVEPRRVDIGRERDLGRGDAFNARVDLYSNARSSVLTGVRKPDLGLRYTLRATLAERTGPRLWEGYAEYGEAASSEEQVFDAMAPLVAGMVGQSTGERRFRAD
jgi:hypothetical protein